MTKYLTKSRFKIAYECPARLYYNEHPDQYANSNLENDFLRALAEGGFQVGALAKLYYPDGVDLEGLKTEVSIRQTNELLKQERIVIFEAALQIRNYLIRVDILEKEKDKIRLIEVKAKSIQPKLDTFYTKDQTHIRGDWEPYLVDVAFQTWVACQALPGSKITPYLMLADKSSNSTVEGLHQRFLIQKDGERSRVITKHGSDLSKAGERLLVEIDVSREVEYLIRDDMYRGMSLNDYAEHLASNHVNNSKIESEIGSYCKGCEFRVGKDLLMDGKKSGFKECLSNSKIIKEKDVEKPNIFEIWRFSKTADMLSQNKFFLSDLREDDLKPKTKSKKDKDGLETSERQWLQIQKTLNGDKTPYIDKEGLAGLFKCIQFPIHCIDFETTRVAIPFHMGMRPYEQIAFQFSHHVIDEKWKIEHKSQYIHVKPGEFPNIEFLRALKASLDNDRGTIFRYAPHENTVLREISRQLESLNPPDKAELKTFIDQITHPTKEEEKEGAIAGKREMVDLLEVVRKYYYQLLMGGSNSIKKVIPTVLAQSKTLQEKYSQTNYGSPGGIKSLNFKDWKWIEKNAKGSLIDPYKRLPPVFSDYPELEFNEEEGLFGGSEIREGGAAMTAWARMQFTEMSEVERNAISQALLKYCELDTLSMVWLLEYFGEVVG